MAAVSVKIHNERAIINCHSVVDYHHKLCSLPFQVIIPSSWIFSVIFNFPIFLVVEVKDGYCDNVWVYGQDWMPKVYDLFWSSLVAVAVAMMAELYSRIVYTLWLIRVEGNQSPFQQRMSTSNNPKTLLV